MENYKFDNEVIKNNIHSRTLKINKEVLLQNLVNENIGKDDSTVNKWFKKDDYSNMTVDKLHIICKALDCFPGEILFVTEDCVKETYDTLKEFLEIFKQYGADCKISEEPSDFLELLELRNMNWNLSAQDVGHNLRKLRIGKQYTEKTLGDKLGCSKVMVSKLENGNSKLTISKLIQCQNILAASAESILYGKEPISPTRIRLMLIKIAKLVEKTPWLTKYL